MTDEERRILIAAREGRLRINYDTFRYVIADERRPDRKTRERLQGRGWLDWADGRPTITAKGRNALTEHGDHR